MKKIFTISCAVLLSFSLSAQTDIGTWLISGSSGLDFASQSITSTDPSSVWDNDDTQTANEMEFGLLGGIFMAPGLVGGIAINYTSESTKRISDQPFTNYLNYPYNGQSGEYELTTKSTSSTITIAPTIRYYIAQSGAWIQTSFAFGALIEKQEYDRDYPSWASYNDDSDSDKESNSLTILEFQAGYAVYLSENISLNPRIGYAISTVTIEDGYNGYNPYNGYYNYYEDDLKITMSGMTFGLGIALHL